MHSRCDSCWCTRRATARVSTSGQRVVHKLIALWCHPRSLSTAFERVMRERGDLTCFHNPFMYWYYLGRGERRFASFEPDPDKPTSYDDIRALLREQADSGPVFFKDMAYYVVTELSGDKAFARELTHIFLIRDPALSIVCYRKLEPEFRDEEVGVTALRDLHDNLSAVLDKAPLVIDAADLAARPETMMRAVCEAVGLEFLPTSLDWQTPPPAEWQSVAGWHQAVSNSVGIRPAEDVDGKGAAAFAEIHASPGLRRIYQQHQSDYETLHRRRLRLQAPAP